jgi:choline dehydrogenase-like flavoprotein
MSNLNIDSVKSRTFDVIVVGSGISGGWAAKEFTEKGLKTLVLERGRDVKHIQDYPTAMKYPWEFEHLEDLPHDIIKANPIASKCDYAFREDAAHFFVKDAEHPYIQDKPFDWIRGYQVGGKSLAWGRASWRWSEFDFQGPARDGFATPWPIGYKDLEKWYSHVERFVGISGNRDGLDTLPDGEFLKPFEMTGVEKYFKGVLDKNYPNRHVVIGRTAHLTDPQPIHYKQGRAKCLNRTLCQRGCPYGGYFSSNSSTLPWAEQTGNFTMRTHSVVHSIIYDENKQKATGVRVIDALTKEMTEYYAPIIFVNASTLNTNLILMNSKSNRFQNGFGNDSDTLGKYLGFHNYRAYLTAEYEGMLDITTEGLRPTGSYVPRFRNVYKQDTNFLRGYASGLNATRIVEKDVTGIGNTLKNSLLNPKLGNWHISAHMSGETIPKETNRVILDTEKTDPFGIPQIKVAVEYDDNDDKMMKDFWEQFEEMYTTAGFKNIRSHDTKQAPGLDIHEMGGVRMGDNPKTSMLNRWNQIHACKNVFVTDGSCMTSTSTQNPSLTYMALTARAANYAMQEMKKKVL